VKFEEDKKPEKLTKPTIMDKTRKMKKMNANDCLFIQKSLAKEFIADKIEKLNSLS